MPSKTESALLTLTCTGCGQTFTRYRSQAGKNPRGVFCSPQCHWEYWEKARPRSLTCEHCGKTIRVQPSQVEKKRQRFCGRACRYLASQRDVAEYFWAHVDKSGECWIWTGPKQEPGGYGHFTISRKQYYAHRVGYELQNGPLAPNEHVLHHCDNPPCVRGDHLFKGDQRKNNEDRDAKGRVRHGAEHPCARLTPELVQTIRAECTAKKRNQRATARKYGVSHSTLQDILKRRTWKHVP